MNHPPDYETSDRSIAQVFLVKYVWEPVLEYIPSWVKPNLLTVLGTFSSLMAALFVRMALHGYHAGYIWASICVFLYLMFDNIDGRHARRTNQSSAFGEFLDHWLDTVNLAIVTLCFATALRLNGLILLLACGAMTITYFSNMWEHCRTGVLQAERFGGTEALVIISIIFMFLYPFGDASWVCYRAGEFTLASFLAYLTIFSGLVTVLMTMARVRKHFFDLVPVALAMALITVWAILGYITPLFGSALLLAMTPVYAGAMVLQRVSGRASIYRQWVTIGFVGVGVIVTLLSPRMSYPLEKSMSYAAVVAVVICLSVDLSRAFRILALGKAERGHTLERIRNWFHRV